MGFMVVAAVILVTTVSIVAVILIRYSVAVESRAARIRRERNEAGRCVYCDYDLRGSVHDCICPECGGRFELYARSAGAGVRRFIRSE
jgi:hypothetical protein